MKKKCKVVMLPTEKASKISLTDIGLILHEETKSKNPQHLYILSDDEIKEGDWIIRDFDNVIIQDNINSDNRRGEKFHKIIATTNPELFKNEFELNSNEQYKLPQIPQYFIELFIKEYNSSNVIKEVMVEYNEWFENDYDGKIVSVLKVTSGNNIIITSVESKMYSREELKSAIIAWDDTLHNTEYTQRLEEWFNKNYPE